MALQLYNTLTRQKEKFIPLDPDHIKMYVCGPTVYDSPHIGNARSVVVYDVLYRLLKRLYPKVTYVRNITDVDDKINAAAIERGITIQQLTSKVTRQFHMDMDALNVLRPDSEPRATTHIPEMIGMIETLIAKGHAYEAQGHVLFSVASDPDYGKLSRRSREDMIAGARVEVAPYKKDPGDFVLWKPTGQKNDPSSVFDSPWSQGRPGWHIECSAMSVKHLGEEFDIHGGGADLMFPHHENEIAQSKCATGKDFARYWVHNGFLTVNGEKMSKSLGNFLTVRELLDNGVKGETIRYALLSTHYGKPLDWTPKLLDDARKNMDYLYRVIEQGDLNNGREYVIYQNKMLSELLQKPEAEIPKNINTQAGKNIAEVLSDDLNLSLGLTRLNDLATSSFEHRNQKRYREADYFALLLKQEASELLGLLQYTPDEWFKGDSTNTEVTDTRSNWINEHINVRNEAKQARNWKEADRIRDELKAQGILLEDRPDGTTDWRRT